MYISRRDEKIEPQIRGKERNTLYEGNKDQPNHVCKKTPMLLVIGNP